ncbi:MAG: hypothetical protein WBL25_17295 [Anaerolineales bacterium]
MTLAKLDRKHIIVQAFYTALTLTGMVLLPIIVHLIPFPGIQPLGAYLLPMFVAPLVAAFYVSPVGLILAAILAPMINNALTGMPQAPLLYFVTSELIVFSIIVFWIVQKEKTFLGFSALAFLVAKIVVMVPRILILSDGFDLPVVGQNLTGLAISIPGILILFAVERLLLRWQQ